MGVLQHDGIPFSLCVALWRVVGLFQHADIVFSFGSESLTCGCCLLILQVQDPVPRLCPLADPGHDD